METPETAQNKFLHGMPYDCIMLILNYLKLGYSTY